MGKTRSRRTQEAATWKAFSRYVRLRDAIRTTGTPDSVVCFTCGAVLRTPESQAGHIVGRAWGRALYNEDVVFAQCPECNMRYEGAHVLGFLHLASLVGIAAATDAVVDAAGHRGFTMHELEDIEEGCLAAAEVLEQAWDDHVRGCGDAA
jgi:hypothetical protein